MPRGCLSLTWWLAACVAVLTLARAGLAQAAEPIGVTAAIEQERMYLGASQRFEIQVRGSRNVTPPDLGAVKGLEIVYRGPSDSSSQSIVVINGRVTSSESLRYTLNYELIPRNTGRFVIPSITVHVDGKPYTTRPIAIEVVEPLVGADSHLDARLDATEAYVGQPLRLTVTWTIAGDIRGFQVDLPTVEGAEVLPGPDPRPMGARVNDNRFPVFQLGGEHAVGVVGDAVINGKPAKTLTFERIIIPRRPGTLTVDALRLDYNAVVGSRPPNAMEFFFDDRAVTERRVSRSRPLEVAVRPLPEQGRPADFSGLVGTYKIHAATDARQAAVGEPIPLRVSVTGPQPLTLVPPLDLSRQGAFPPEQFRVPRTPVLGEVRGNSMVYETSVRARTEDVKSIPGIVLNYFDTGSGKYVVDRTPAIPIAITPSANIGLPGDENEEVAPAPDTARPGGLAPIDRTPPRPASWLDFPRGLRDPILVGVLAGPPLLYAALMSVLSLLRLSRLDPAAHRRRVALRTALAGLDRVNGGTLEAAWAGIRHAITTYVADWFDRAPEALTSDEVVQLIRSDRRAGPALADEARSILEQFDAARFGRASGWSDAGQAARAARSLLVRLDQVLRRRAPAQADLRPAELVPRAIVTSLALCAALAAVSPARAAEPDQSIAADVWQQAQDAYDQGVAKLSSASPKPPHEFARAADAFERIAGDPAVAPASRARAWFNAGNARAQAGQPAHAILCLRRAQSIDPYIAGLDENLGAARLKAGSSPPPAPELLDQWRRASLALPRFAWLLIASLPLACACLLSAAGQWRPVRHSGSIIRSLVLIAIVGGLGLVAHITTLGRSPDAVVLTPTSPRRGPDSVIFDAGAPISPGAELRILESRTSASGEPWVRIGTDKSSDAQAWVPESSITRVDRSAGRNSGR